MRKSIVIAVFGAACIAMLAGCANGGVLTGSKSNNTSSSTASNTETTANSSSNIAQVTTEEVTTSPVLAEPTTGSSKYKALNDWYVENKDDLDDIADSLSTDELTCTISCEGNVLTYTYTFTNLIDEKTSLKVSTTLFDALDSDEYKEKFNNAANQLSNYVEGTCYIVVRYNNADGKAITQKTYFG